MATEATSKSSTELASSCHCGAITLTVNRLPVEINQCQCTICRRYAAAWGYWKTDEVTFDFKEGAKFNKYMWGDKEKTFNFCSECGCVMCWWPLEEKDADGKPAECGLNTRMMDPMALFYVDRKIENSWIKAAIGNGGARHRDDQATY